MNLSKYQRDESDKNNNIQRGEGHYYENQNIENQKEHQKKFKASEHQKYLFSSSLLQHHYIEIDKDHYYKSSWSLPQKSEHRKEWK